MEFNFLKKLINYPKSVIEFNEDCNRRVGEVKTTRV